MCLRLAASDSSSFWPRACTAALAQCERIASAGGRRRGALAGVRPVRASAPDPAGRALLFGYSVSCRFASQSLRSQSLSVRMKGFLITFILGHRDLGIRFPKGLLGLSLGCGRSLRFVGVTHFRLLQSLRQASQSELPESGIDSQRVLRVPIWVSLAISANAWRFPKARNSLFAGVNRA
jgi:hypothetical protein